MDGINLLGCDADGRIAGLVSYWDPTPMIAAAASNPEGPA